MIIKPTFSLLGDAPNVLKGSANIMLPFEVENGAYRLAQILKISEKRIKHFTKEKVEKELFVSREQVNETFMVVNIQRYPLPVSYNEIDGKIIINLIGMGSEDLSRIDFKNLYSAVVYGLCFKNLVTGKAKISLDYGIVIINFLLSLLMKLFGKRYGLLGTYSSEIAKLKFLLACYVYNGFFGIEDRSELYRLSLKASNYNYKTGMKLEDLEDIDFYDIKGFIKSLDFFKVMPGINDYIFTIQIDNLLGSKFIPALEDISRFFSITCVSSLIGNALTPTFISKYNEKEYNKILDICKSIFRK